MSMENVERNNQIKKCLPSAARLILGMRDTGYTFTSAVADIVDNAVTAGATTISIQLEITRRGRLIFMLADNGHGMDKNSLENAMQYGSQRRVDPASLGKFGLGLKTASTSFCKKLTVMSRKDGQVNILQWDLDLVEQKEEWLLVEPDLITYEEPLEFLNEITAGSSGTIVIWENIDRLIKADNEKYKKEQVIARHHELEQHLSGVFYNFLEKQNNFPDIQILINGKNVAPWDPFCRWLNTAENPTRLEVHNQKPLKRVNEQNEIIGEIAVNVYILPTKNELSKEEVDRSRYGLDNQGFHIFREGRMIYSGGWPNRLFVKDPHLNLVRVELNFDHRLDDYFQIDIKKSRVDLPAELKDQLKIMINPAKHEADKRYRRDGHKRKNGNSVSHENSSNSIKGHHDETTSGVAVLDVNNVTGEVDIRNKFDTSKVRLLIDQETNKLVQSKDTLEDGVLWAPGLVNGNLHAVFLNESHEFYKKFYLANRDKPALILAMDAVLWSLSEAELSVFTDKVKRNLEDYRINVSRILRHLAEDLPELNLPEDINDTEDEE